MFQKMGHSNRELLNNGIDMCIRIWYRNCRQQNRACHTKMSVTILVLIDVCIFIFYSLLFLLHYQAFVSFINHIFFHQHYIGSTTWGGDFCNILIFVTFVSLVAGWWNHSNEWLVLTHEESTFWISLWWLCCLSNSSSTIKKKIAYY